MSPAGFVSFVILVLWVIGIYNIGLLAGAKLLGAGVFRPSAGRWGFLAALLAGKAPDVEPPEFAGEFVIGFGPRLVDFSLGGTRFQLRLIPFGGGVKTGGFSSTWRFYLWRVGGAIAVLATAPVALYLILLCGVYVRQRPGALVVDPLGLHDVLQEGDVVVRAGGRDVEDGTDLARELTQWRSGKMTLEVEHEGARRVVVLDRAAENSPPRWFAFRSVTEVQYPGPVEALRRTPAALVDILVFWDIHSLSKDERLGVQVGLQPRFQILLIWMLAFAGFLLLIETLCYAIGSAVRRRLRARGAEPKTAERWERICYFGLFAATWGLVLLVDFYYVPAHAGPLLNSPFLERVVRDLPFNVYWEASV